jgi:hypothetical protein
MPWKYKLLAELLSICHNKLQIQHTQITENAGNAVVMYAYLALIKRLYLDNDVLKLETQPPVQVSEQLLRRMIEPNTGLIEFPLNILLTTQQCTFPASDIMLGSFIYNFIDTSLFTLVAACISMAQLNGKAERLNNLQETLKQQHCSKIQIFENSSNKHKL